MLLIVLPHSAQLETHYAVIDLQPVPHLQPLLITVFLSKSNAACPQTAHTYDHSRTGPMPLSQEEHVFSWSRTKEHSVPSRSPCFIINGSY